MFLLVIAFVMVYFLSKLSCCVVWLTRNQNGSQLQVSNVKISFINIPDSKVHEANMGPIWGRQDPGGPHVGTMNFAIWDIWILSIRQND